MHRCRKHTEELRAARLPGLLLVADGRVVSLGRKGRLLTVRLYWNVSTASVQVTSARGIAFYVTSDLGESFHRMGCTASFEAELAELVATELYPDVASLLCEEGAA